MANKTKKVAYNKLSIKPNKDNKENAGEHGNDEMGMEEKEVKIEDAGQGDLEDSEMHHQDMDSEIIAEN